MGTSHHRRWKVSSPTPYTDPVSATRRSAVACEHDRVPVSVAGLASISRRLFKERLSHEPWVAEAGLRPPSYGVMSYVARLEPVSQKQISDLMGVDPSDMVSVIDILERAGFIARDRDADDRRRYSLNLTTAGRNALRRLDRIAAAGERGASCSPHRARPHHVRLPTGAIDESPQLTTQRVTRCTSVMTPNRRVGGVRGARGGARWPECVPRIGEDLDADRGRAGGQRVDVVPASREVPVTHSDTAVVSAASSARSTTTRVG